MSKHWDNGLKALYQQTRQELPPQELNQKIRLAAQKAVQRKSTNLKWYLSSAAVVLLAVNVVLFTYVPETEMIDLPGQTPSLSRHISSAPKYIIKPSAPTPTFNYVPLMDYTDDEIDTQKLKETERLLQSDIVDIESYSNMSISESNDLFEYSLQKPTEEINQSLEMHEAFRPSKSGYNIRYPKNLPFDVRKLIAGNPTLTGRQSRDSIEINQNNKLILKMTRNKQGILIEAYSGAQLWGVFAEWGQSSKDYLKCFSEDHLICQLTKDVQGGFENDHLNFMRWIQKNEP